MQEEQWSLEEEEGLTCFIIPKVSRETTPMPALPAPTTTNVCWAIASTVFPCTARAPYMPATAVAAVPCNDLKTHDARQDTRHASLSDIGAHT